MQQATPSTRPEGQQWEAVDSTEEQLCGGGGRQGQPPLHCRQTVCLSRLMLPQSYRAVPNPSLQRAPPTPCMPANPALHISTPQRSPYT